MIIKKPEVIFDDMDNLSFKGDDDNSGIFVNSNQAPNPFNQSGNIDVNISSFLSKNMVSNGGNTYISNENINTNTSPLKLNLVRSTNDLDKSQEKFISMTSPRTSVLEESQNIHDRSNANIKNATIPSLLKNVNTTSKSSLGDEIKNNDSETRLTTS